MILPGVDIGARCRLRKVVVDDGCRLPEGMIIGWDAKADAQRFYRSPGGVVLVTSAMLEALEKASNVRCEPHMMDKHVTDHRVEVNALGAHAATA